MTPVEIMALAFVVFATVKIVTLLIHPKSWLTVVKKIYKNPALTTVVAFVLAGASLYYLLAELTIVQIFAAMLLISLLLVIGVAAYSKDLVQLAEKVLKDEKMIKKASLAIIAWIALISWALYELVLRAGLQLAQ